MEEKKISRQDPTTEYILPYKDTDGPFAVDVYELSGRMAYPWQRGVIFDILAKDPDGMWTHMKFGYAVPRQNGKNEILVMRELIGLVSGERILHTRIW